MYEGDFSDYLLPNSPLSGVTANCWCPSVTGEGWSAKYTDNTNSTLYLTSILAPYMSGQLGVYKCPGDDIPSDNGPRLRSYSMQMQMGCVYTKALVASYNLGYMPFVKVTDLNGSTLAPSDAFVFCEENMNTMNDGFLQIDSTGANGYFPDCPGSYHGLKVCGFSFADGHTEAHKWQTGVLSIPIVAGQGYQAGGVLPKGVTILNPDWLWFTRHATVKQ